MDDSRVDFSLRPAADEDLPLLAEIERRVHIAPWSESHFRAEILKEYSQTWVLTDDDTDQKIAGYIVFWTLMGECQVLNVAVDLPFRGRGFAKQMVRKVIQESLRGSGDPPPKLFLEVRKSNSAAIQLYQGLGFATTQVRKAFYSDGEDAYFMVFQLDNDSEFDSL